MSKLNQRPFLYKLLSNIYFLHSLMSTHNPGSHKLNLANLYTALATRRFQKGGVHDEYIIISRLNQIVSYLSIIILIIVSLCHPKENVTCNNLFIISLVAFRSGC